MMGRLLTGAGLVLVLAAGSGGALRAQQPSDPQIEVLHIRGPVYLIAGGGANVVVSVGPDGVLAVDAGLAAHAPRVLAAIQTLQRQLAQRPGEPIGWGALSRSTLDQEWAPPGPAKPIRFVISTNGDSDHIGGNAVVLAAGKTITGGNVAGDLGDAQDGAALYAHENVLLRMSRNAGPGEALVLPTDTYFTPFLKLSHFFNGEGVQLIHLPKAHTDGDSMVWFRATDVLAVGDVFSTVAYPAIDIDRGGSIDGVIEALNDILDLGISEFRTEGGTIVVPGHGAISDLSDVAYYRDMVTKIRDRIAASINKGLSLAQVKASRPTRDYDRRYGQPSGPSSPDGFVEAIYRNLTAKTS